MRRVALALALSLALPSAAGAQTLVVWHAYGERESLGLVDAVHVWEQAHPGVHVDLVASPFGAYASRLRTAVPTGHGPDLFVDAHNRLATYVAEEIVVPFGEHDPADFDPRVLEALRYEGADWGAPLSVKCLALYVWDDLAGGPFPDLEAIEARQPALPAGTVPLVWELGSSYATAGLFHAYGAVLLDDGGRFAAATPAGRDAL
ncbi:MAG TPA: extracellular solute-binding protein, partial [Polyangiaceae bacterium]|nr:extracellular solute-binding protein [Polyangiaceae bacterium]